MRNFLLILFCFGSTYIPEQDLELTNEPDTLEVSEPENEEPKIIWLNVTAPVNTVLDN